MDDLERMFRASASFDISTLRIMTLVCAVAVGLLYLYRLGTVVHCMRQPIEKFPAATDRIIWVALAMMIPLGLGALLYDIVRRERFVPLLFIVPFVTVVGSMLWITFRMMPLSSNISFEFLGI